MGDSSVTAALLSPTRSFEPVLNTRQLLSVENQRLRESLETAILIANKALDEWEARSPNWEDCGHVSVRIAAARATLERVQVV